jgi:serine/threonine-protein phosphatase 4 catalytic subunit
MLKKIEERLLALHKPTRKEVRMVCTKAIDLLALEQNIQTMSPPVVVCGDIHGQYDDLLNIFRINGTPQTTKYVFLGDYVDRGPNSVETIVLLLLYKAMYPENIVLLRGNHESKELAETYGLYKEIVTRYHSSDVWRILCEAFHFLPLACLIGGRVFAVHGGISPFAVTFEQIKSIHRFVDTPKHGPMADMLWSDPGHVSGCVESERGAGYIFGPDLVHRFLFLNDAELVCRSHQLVNEGYRFAFSNRELVTVWSAPNYCNRMGNKATVLRIGESLEVTDSSFIFFEQTTRHVKTLAPLHYFS